MTNEAGSGWIGVDLDRTLAKYDRWGDGSVGEPLTPMLERVKGWLAAGKDVRIVTARVGPGATFEQSTDQRTRIQLWCRIHLGRVLPVTASKDFTMLELWDDRCVQVDPNTGVPTLERLEQDRKELLAMVRDLVAEANGSGETLRMAAALLKRFDG